MNELEESPPIVDKYFYHCIKKVSEEHSSNICCFTTRTAIIVFVLLLHCYVTPPKDKDITDAFTFLLKLMLFYNIIELSRLLYFSHKKLKNTSVIIKIANDFNHCLYADDFKENPTEQLNDDIFIFEMQSQWGLKVSSVVYDFHNLEKASEISQQNMEIRQSVGKNAFISTLESQVCCYRWFGCLIQTFGIGVLVYSVVLAVQLPLPSFQDTFIQLFILVEIMLKPKILVVLFIIGLVPIILLVLGIYVCFCKKQEIVNLPEPQVITKESLQKCSDCAICFQTFVEEQKAIFLSCSDKHVFHQTCIGGWVKVKPTCPICRSEV